VKGTSLLDAHRADYGANALWMSQKEMCEQTLVTDLLRNDLNTVCVPGSVTVDSPFEVRAAGDLLQMQSVIQGQLENPLISNAEILQRTLPAGSVTGTPKQAVCQYLSELESTPRGYYTGVFALAAGASQFDSALLIRGFFSYGSVWNAGMGAGITTLSDVSAEVSEFSLKWQSFSQRWVRLLNGRAAQATGHAVDAHALVPLEKWRSLLVPAAAVLAGSEQISINRLQPAKCAAPVLFLDHFDSFAQNLVAALRERGCPVEQKLSSQGSTDDEDFLNRVEQGAYSALVLSPGPGRPDDYPLSQKVLSLWPEERPVLGVCLGHQLLLTASGCTLELVAGNPVHGRSEKVEPLFPPMWLKDNSSSDDSVFYNSWAVSAAELMKSAAQWRVTGVNGGWVACCEHTLRPWVGVQFHPESFASLAGKRLIDAFVDLWRSRTLA
jgi:anthranilate/para-aminobenzoate synthase component II